MKKSWGFLWSFKSYWHSDLSPKTELKALTVVQRSEAFLGFPQTHVPFTEITNRSIVTICIDSALTYSLEEMSHWGSPFRLSSSSCVGENHVWHSLVGISLNFKLHICLDPDTCVNISVELILRKKSQPWCTYTWPGAYSWTRMLLLAGLALSWGLCWTETAPVTPSDGQFETVMKGE